MSEAGRQPPDRELLLRLRQDDSGGLEVLVERYWAMVVGFVRGTTSSPDAAEDVAQEVFVRVWERRRSWGLEGSVRALLLRLARNEAVSRHRSEEAARRAAEEADEDVGTTTTPSQDFARRRLAESLEEAIASLPPRRREVFVLRAMHDLPYREIADVMGISVQTVANQYSRALTQLRGLLRSQLPV